MDEINKKVIQDNIIAHDLLSDSHDSLVSYSRFKKNRKQYFNKMLEISEQDLSGKEVLELACGTGIFLEELSDVGFGKYTGLDLSPKMINIASSKIDKEKPIFKKASFICDDFLTSDKLVNESYDFIFSFSFIHHLYSLDDFESKIYNLLKKGGVFIGMHEPNPGTRRNLVSKVDSMFYKFSCQIQSFFELITNQKKKFNNLNKKYLESPYIDYQLDHGNFEEYLDKQITSKYSYYDFLGINNFLPNNYNAVIIRKEK
tara:strand:+ start:8984 stop:9757 length:774 start_codon:yes stop_codon:yes gene_type:complete